MKKVKVKYIFRENKKRWYPSVTYKDIDTVVNLPKVVVYRGYAFEFYFYNSSKENNIDYEVFYKEIHPNFYEKYKADHIESLDEGSPPKCDCGGEHTTLKTHSYWCSSREENWSID